MCGGLRRSNQCVCCSAANAVSTHKRTVPLMPRKPCLTYAARERTTHINGHVSSYLNIALGPPEDTLECVAEGAFECVAERRSHPALSPLRP